MKQPDIVIGHYDGQVEIIYSATNVDFLVLHFDVLDEYGEPEEKEEADKLAREGKYNELCEFLADIEEKVSNEGRW